MKRIIYSLAFSVCLVPLCAEAANRYVRPGATGLNNGSDWANAYSKLPATLTRGDTYYLAGGSYGSYTFSTPVSGTTPITVRKATVADHGVATGWSDTYGSTQALFSGLAFKTSYHVFDGVTGGGPGNWETGFGFKVKATYHTIDFPAVLSDITLRHVDIEGGGRAATSDTDLLYLVNKFTNITVSYCFLHDTSRTMILTWPASGNGMLIEYSKFARNGNAEHREAWSAGADSNVIVRHNLFEDILGTGVIAIVNSKGVASNWDVYGNVFYHTGKYTDGIINTGVLFNRYDAGGSPIAVQASNWHVYNNVVANIRNGSFTAAFTSENSVNYVAENNIWFNNQPSDVGANGVATADYNWFYGNGGSGARGPHDINGTGSPFVDAQPWISGNWALKAPIGGLALAAPYNIDMNGTVRGADGVFDRGALEFSSQAAAVPAPTNLQVK